VTSALGALGILRIMWPGWFTRLALAPVRCRWRWWWCYRRRWRAALTIAGLGPSYRGQITLPALGKVQAGQCADLVTARLVSGQSPKLFADRAEELAHGFGAHSRRVRTARPGTVVLEFVRRDALAAVIPAAPIPAVPDLKALPVGRGLFEKFGKYAADPAAIADLRCAACWSAEKQAASEATAGCTPG
jgi:DNA segregation ATPase FtsK/SpoIIIE, S-DNA-T family